jgi:hypothetical protein
MTGGQGMPGRRGAVAAALAISFALAISPSLGAKEETTKIAISGADLTSPIAITDPVILRQFNVWSGAGTFRALGGLDTKSKRPKGSSSIGRRAWRASGRPGFSATRGTGFVRTSPGSKPWGAFS